MPVSIAVVEDEPLWQQGIKALLATVPHVALIGVYDNAAQAKAAITPNNTQLVLLDWKLGAGEDGLAVAEYLLTLGFQPWQMVLITGSPQEQLPEGLEYGYVCKSQIAGQLVPTLQALLPKLQAL